MIEKLDNELLENVIFWVRSAFYDKETVAEDLICQLEEYFEAEDEDIENMPDEEEVYSFVEDLFDKYGLKEHGSNFSRLVKVFDKLSKEKIITIHNAGYTMEDGLYEVSVAEETLKENKITPLGFCFYHEQDMQRAMADKDFKLLLAFHYIEDVEDKSIEIGEKIIKCLESENFDVAWDKKHNHRIQINNFKWDKACDDEDYTADRSIEIMLKNKR